MKRRLALMTVCMMLACTTTACVEGFVQDTFDEIEGKMQNAYSPEYNNGNLTEDVKMEAAESGGYYMEYDMMPQMGTEEYNKITENGFLFAAEHPMSTFSVDVDTASYSNIRRMIRNNQVVNPDAVRIEEMINYFSYDYTAPAGDVPFSVNTELYDCPWNEESELLLVGLQAEEIDLSDRKPMNLVFLIDVSGSMMDYNKLPLVQKAFAMLSENLNKNDRVSIVTYAGEESIVLQGAYGSEYAKITDSIYSLTAGGSTAGAAGINCAYELAEEFFIEGGNNRVILATDGDLNVGPSSEEELTRLIEHKRKNGVHLSVLGFGTGNIKDDRMEALADHGNGNYAYIDSLLEARKVLVKEMGGTLFTVAKDVKIQTEFDPEYIESYRLIGYENRVLANEDFENDQVDAGEIGAGHSVTALYELVLTDRAEEGAELLNVALRYKEPDVNESRLVEYPVQNEKYETIPENLAFAAAVAEFGMLLRDSKYAGTASYQQIRELLGRTDMENEYRKEFSELVTLGLD